MPAQPEHIDIQDVQNFWDSNPLCSAWVPHPAGTPEFFAEYDRLRERNESVEFQNWFFEYQNYSGKKILDVGCGNGYILSRYAQSGAEVHGVDISPVAVEISRKRFDLLGLTADLRVANAEELPFDEATFDCVTSIGVLHHTPHTEKGVHEIHRVLKPGGKFLTMLYYRDSALYRFGLPVRRFLEGKSIQEMVNEVDGIGNPKGDVYSKAEMTELLGEFGNLKMHVRLLQGWMLLPRGGRLVPNAILKPFEKKWGWFLYAKAEKPNP